MCEFWLNPRPTPLLILQVRRPSTHVFKKHMQTLQGLSLLNDSKETSGPNHFLFQKFQVNELTKIYKDQRKLKSSSTQHTSCTLYIHRNSNIWDCLISSPTAALVCAAGNWSTAPTTALGSIYTSIITNSGHTSMREVTHCPSHA